jgi:hypothetical protein
MTVKKYSKEKSILAKQINVSVYVSVKTNFYSQHRLNLNYLRLQHDMTKNYQNYFLWLLNLRKKKKLKVLQENIEENDINGDYSQPSKYSTQSVSKIMVSTNDSHPDFANQKSYLSNVTPNKHVVIGKTLSMDNETEEELTPRLSKKKKKKVKVKGMQQSFDDFPTENNLH